MAICWGDHCDVASRERSDASRAPWLTGNRPLPDTSTSINAGCRPAHRHASPIWCARRPHGGPMAKWQDDRGDALGRGLRSGVTRARRCMTGTPQLKTHCGIGRGIEGIDDSAGSYAAHSGITPSTIINQQRYPHQEHSGENSTPGDQGIYRWYV